MLSDWVTFQRQIPAGLNYAISGMPYWTTDIGGFISGGNLNDPKFRELFVRWFQFGVFSPIFRVHGTRSPDENELWSYGPDAQKILVDFDTLRYRLLPYIYSLAWQVTSNHATLMRPLVMDWRTTSTRRTPATSTCSARPSSSIPCTRRAPPAALSICPRRRGTTSGPATSSTARSTFRPRRRSSKLPLYVRAGSILPMGPAMEWSTQKPADPIELRIYPGADGDFTLYEDENDNYDYTKGAARHHPAPLERRHPHAHHRRAPGQLPRHVAQHTFHVVLVSKDHGAGIDPAPTADKTIVYGGTEAEVKP